MGLESNDLALLSPAAQRQVMEKMRKPGKYKAQTTKRGKLTFDSKKEAERYDALMLLQKAGERRGLKLQVRYCLQEAYTTFEGDRVKSKVSTTLRTSCTSAGRLLTATDSGTGCRWWRT